MAILYCPNSEMLLEILTKPIFEVCSVTLVYVDKNKRMGFDRNSESQQALLDIIGSNGFVWHPQDREPTLLSDDEAEYDIRKKAGGPCLVFSNVEDDFKSQIENIKQYNKDKVKARLKKIEFETEIPLLTKLFTGNERKLESNSLLNLSGMCEYLTIWRFGDLGLYCHLVSRTEVPYRLLLGAKKVSAFPEW